MDEKNFTLLEKLAGDAYKKGRLSIPGLKFLGYDLPDKNENFFWIILAEFKGEIVGIRFGNSKMGDLPYCTKCDDFNHDNCDCKNEEAYSKKSVEKIIFDGKEFNPLQWHYMVCFSNNQFARVE